MELQKKIAGILAQERDRYVLWTPVLLGTGIGAYFLWPTEPPLWAAILAVGLGFLAVWRAGQRVEWRLGAMVATMIAIGFLAACIRTAEVDAPALFSQLYARTVEGRVDDIQQKQKGAKLILTQAVIEGLKPATAPNRISVSLKKEADLAIGDRIRVKAVLFPPPTAAMPGGYDFSRQFFYDRVGAVGYSPGAPEVLEHADRHNFEEWLNALRLSLNDRIVAPMDKENGPVAAALMVGEMSDVSPEVGEAMRNAGLYHVLSISGLHMSLAVGLLYVSLRFLFSLYPRWALRLPVKKIAAFIGLLGALAYLLLAGYPVPAVRSFVMVACMMLAVLFDRQGLSLYSLAWAATLVLLFAPESIFGASFQLSFAATLFIIAFYENYRHLLHQPDAGWLRTLWLYFFGLMVTSLVATLATTPLVIYHFNRFTLWGIAANMLMVPLASFWIMPAAVLAFLLLPLGLEHWPLVALDKGIGLMIAGSRWFASLPYASISVVPPSFIGIVFVIFGGLWICLWRTKWRRWGVVAVVIGMATVLLHKPYDLLINDETTQVAVRMEDGRFLFLRGKPESFDGQAWLRYHGLDNGLIPDDLTPPPDCDRERCLFMLRGHSIALAKRKDGGDALCATKPDILITPGYLDDPACREIKLAIDKHFLRKSGAVGIRFEGDGMEIGTARQIPGNRPWNKQPQYRLYHSDNRVITSP